MLTSPASVLSPRIACLRTPRLAVETLLLVAWTLAFGVLAQDRTNSTPPSASRRFVSWDDIKAKWGHLPLAEIQMAADKGDSTAQHYLGRYYFDGLGGTTNQAEGLKWYRKAASQGFPNAQNNLGVAYLNGLGVPVDKVEGRRWMQLAAQTGDPVSRLNLAQLQADGVGGPRDEAAARRTLEQLAKGGDPEAQYQLGRYLMTRKGVSLEVKNAVHWYRKAGEQGVPEACAELGRLYAGDWGISNPEEALYWLRKGAAAGHAHSKHLLGWAYVKGRGVKPDRNEALKWVQASAEGGDVGAHTDLGRLYELSDLDFPGAQPDFAKAAEWYRKGAQLRDADSAFRLARLARQGHIQAPQEDILKWLRVAADQEHKGALLLLAGLYDQGQVPGSPPGETALKLYWTLERIGRAEDSLRLAHRYREGNGVPKDPILTAYLYLEALVRSLGDEARAEVLSMLRPSGNQDQTGSRSDRPTADFARELAVFMRAVEKGDQPTQLDIARRYLKGDGGLPRNEFEACFWFSFAAAQGAPGAADEAAKLRGSLTEAQLSDLKRRVNLTGFGQGWLRQHP